VVAVSLPQNPKTPLIIRFNLTYREKKSRLIEAR